MINAISIDLEEHFQVHAFENLIDRRRWDEQTAFHGGHQTTSQVRQCVGTESRRQKNTGHRRKWRQYTEGDTNPDENGGRQVPQSQRVWMAPHQTPFPDTVLKILPPEFTNGTSDVVDIAKVWQKEYPSTRLDEAIAELIVLVPYHVLVEQPDPFKQAPRPRSVSSRINVAWLFCPNPVMRATQGKA